jgi:LysR family transcriptional regulator for metE and metH
MELRHLKLVQALASEGTLTAAGKRLFLSQSALSHQLREIEDELGVLLFQRIKKRMVMTPAGERMLQSADTVLGELHNVQSDIKQFASGDAGTLRIGACSHACFHWLPPVLKSFKDAYPRVEIQIDTSSAHDPTAHLLTGSIDVAILNFKDSNSKIAYLKLFDDEMVAVVRSDHQWASMDHVSARHFADVDLINYDISLEDVVFNKKVLMPAGVTPKSVINLPMTDAILEMVREGLGVAVLNRWSIRPYLESPDLCGVRVTKNGFKRTWYAALIDSEQKPAYVARFIGFLTNQAQN